MNNKLYIVSGCPRSGTSLMMDCMRAALGEDRLIGNKFPILSRRKKFLEQAEEETEVKYKWRIYSTNILHPDKRDMDKIKDMNPNGFFENELISVRGIRYNPLTKDLIKQIRYAEQPYFAKIVSQGLAMSDPSLIKKIVFMIRNPYSVAKSQERLRRDGEFTLEGGRKIDVFKDVKVNSPEMFINVTLSAAKWIADNPEVDIHYVEYDDLIADPSTVITEIGKFIGEGDFTKSIPIVDPSLKRSEPEKKPNDLWEDADVVYELFKKQEFDKLSDIFNDKTRQINRQNNNWVCLRYGEQTYEAHCKTCKVSKEFRDSLKSHAEKKGIDWKSLACAYECAYDLDNPTISIEESIDNNFWVDDE